MRVLLRFLSYLILLPLLIWIIWLNIRLHHGPAFESESSVSVNADLRSQLTFLANAIDEGAGEEMQELFPEGAMFLHVLYGVAACDLLEAAPPESALYEEALAHVDRALSFVFSEEGRQPFDETLSVPYGAFYHGWAYYLLGRKLEVLPRSKRSRKDARRLRQACDQTRDAWQRLGHPYIESYYQAAWPADGIVCAATLALYERLSRGRYTADLANWIEQVAARTDEFGLIPHSVVAESGEPATPAEGNALGLALTFLYDIAPNLAEQQFRRYDSLFVTTRLGLPAIRQYPAGEQGGGDIDSGPVIWGIGGAASVVGIRTLATYGAQTEAIGLRSSVEAFGLGMTLGKEKRYLLGQMPILDAFVAWAIGIEATPTTQLKTLENWSMTFHLISLGVGIGVVLLLLFLHWATRKRSSDTEKDNIPPSTPSPSQKASRPVSPSTSPMSQRRTAPDPPQWELPE